jgi:soluble lytic murein transglycosylase-like protein
MENLALYFILTTSNLDLPQDLLASICYVESKYKSNAVHHDDGNSDSLGVCQIKLGTAKMLGFKGVKNELINNPGINILYSGLYLKKQLKRYHGDTKKAIAAYNSGTYRNSKTNMKYYKKVYFQWKGIHDYH